MCCEYREDEAWSIVQPSQWVITSWCGICSGSNEALYTHPKALAMSVKASICWLFPSVYHTRYIVIESN